jgi:hypothetical protein
MAAAEVAREHGVFSTEGRDLADRCDQPALKACFEIPCGIVERARVAKGKTVILLLRQHRQSGCGRYDP